MIDKRTRDWVRCIKHVIDGMSETPVDWVTLMAEKPWSDSVEAD